MSTNSSLPGEYVPVSTLAYEEVGFFHPGNWAGETVGYRVKEERVAPFSPIPLGFRNAGALIKAGGVAKEARRRAHFEPKRFSPVAVYKAGEEFQPQAHEKDIVVFDQSTLITRGPEFHLKPEEFPKQPPFRHPDAKWDPVHVSSKRFHYVRELAASAILGKGSDAQLVRAGTMDYFAPATEYPYAVGPIAVPGAVTVGEPTHFMTQDDQQILLNTHAVIVYPKLGSSQ